MTNIKAEKDLCHILFCGPLKKKHCRIHQLTATNVITRRRLTSFPERPVKNTFIPEHKLSIMKDSKTLCNVPQGNLTGPHVFYFIKAIVIALILTVGMVFTLCTIASVAAWF